MAVVGFVLFFLGFPVVYLNEQRQVKMWELFGRAEAMCLTDVDTEAVDPGKEAHLVHVAGTASTADTLKDEDFGIQVTNCAKLERLVEMYQWEEHEHTTKSGDTEITTYTYSKTWSSRPISSSGFHDFGHDNPKSMPIDAPLEIAEVKLGAFTLSKRLVAEEMKAWQDCTSLAKPPVTVGKLVFEEQGFYLGSWKGSALPSIGDVRVKFRKVPCAECTVVAVQHGSSFAPLLHGMHVADGKVTRGGKMKHQTTEAVLDHADDDDAWVRECGAVPCCAFVSEAMGRKEVYELAEETLSAPAMFERAHAEENWWHMMYLVGGWVCFVVGLFLVFNVVPVVLATPLRLLYAWSVADAMQRVGQMLAFALALVLGSMVFLLTYAVSWVVARPLKAGVALAVVLGLSMVPFYLKAETAAGAALL
jgi:hypothetical protein